MQVITKKSYVRSEEYMYRTARCSRVSLVLGLRVIRKPHAFNTRTAVGTSNSKERHTLDSRCFIIS